MRIGRSILASSPVCEPKHKSLLKTHLIWVTLIGDGCHRHFASPEPECGQLMGVFVKRKANETYWHAGGARNWLPPLLPSAPEKGRSLRVLSALDEPSTTRRRLQSKLETKGAQLLRRAGPDRAGRTSSASRCLAHPVEEK